MRILIKKRAVMKKSLSIFIILLFILFILIYPADCVRAAAGGLILWYENILPALLPFTIFSSLLIQSGYLDDIVRTLKPALDRMFFHHSQVFPLAVRRRRTCCGKENSRWQNPVSCAPCAIISVLYLSAPICLYLPWGYMIRHGLHMRFYICRLFYPACFYSGRRKPPASQKKEHQYPD